MQFVYPPSTKEFTSTHSEMPVNSSIKCWFLRRGETGVPGEKPLREEKKTNNKLNLHMTLGPGIKPGTHWWEVSALTTAPSLLPLTCPLTFNTGYAGLASAKGTITI